MVGTVWRELGYKLYLFITTHTLSQYMLITFFKNFKPQSYLASDLRDDRGSAPVRPAAARP